ncbi:MAG: helix-turn-helix transcriptional regulator [Notoacmeibacter sp.]|nr:helix-turn-helix transcriptional regulator [Notoacmeibacter sp.]
MKHPLPDSPVRGSNTGRPVMALLDLLGRKTALRVLWELSKRSLKFRPLQEAAETSPGVLNARLGELRAAGLVERGTDGYNLTTRGRELGKLLLPLVHWSEDWARELATYDACQ